MNSFMPGYEDMELSTQIIIRDALKRGITVEILDRKEQIIRLKKGRQTEYVKQATRTSADHYIAPLLMENKEVTKLLLYEKGFRVPEGKSYDNNGEMEKAYPVYTGKSIVVKPKSTNFGKGITILKPPFSFNLFYEAAQTAFLFDSSLLIEEFIDGTEYRFLVIGDRTVAVLERVPAHINGNGFHTIRQLVDEKNKNPLRGIGYTLPLEQIQLNEPELSLLKEQALTPESVPEKGQTVYLRKNSNISTGGDSIDHTDSMPEELKTLAVKAAQTVGAKICGVDIIIKNPDKGTTADNYGIIELNFNPALHIHNYPYKGKNRDTGNAVLDLLGFDKE